MEIHVAKRHLVVTEIGQEGTSATFGHTIGWSVKIESIHDGFLLGSKCDPLGKLIVRFLYLLQ